MVSFAQVTANPGLVQDRKILELYDKRGNCKVLSSHKDIVYKGKDKEERGERTAIRKIITTS